MSLSREQPVRRDSFGDGLGKLPVDAGQRRRLLIEEPGDEGCSGLVARGVVEKLPEVSSGHRAVVPGTQQLQRRRIKNVVWLTADVHYCAANHYDPSRASFTDFDPFWEFVAGPSRRAPSAPTSWTAPSARRRSSARRPTTPTSHRAAGTSSSDTAPSTATEPSRCPCATDGASVVGPAGSHVPTPAQP